MEHRCRGRGRRQLVRRGLIALFIPTTSACRTRATLCPPPGRSPGRDLPGIRARGRLRKIHIGVGHELGTQLGARRIVRRTVLARVQRNPLHHPGAQDMQVIRLWGLVVASAVLLGRGQRQRLPDAARALAAVAGLREALRLSRRPGNRSRGRGDRHLRGQSYALFFALVDNDQARFEQLRRWTSENLAGGRLGERLPAWKWGRTETGEWGVLDENSAANADLWMAYSLLEGGRL